MPVPRGQSEVMRDCLLDQIPLARKTVDPITVASRRPSLWKPDRVLIEFKADIIQVGAPFAVSRKSRYDLCHPQGGIVVWFRPASSARWNDRFRAVGGGPRGLSRFRFGKVRGRHHSFLKRSTI